MLVRQQQSLTSTIRQICTQIEQEINTLIQKASSPPRNSPQLLRIQHQRTIQQLKNAVIQLLTARLPTLINYEQELNEQIYDLQDEIKESQMKYRKIFQKYQNNQLENDKLKIQVIALSQNYQQLSVEYAQIKYKYHQLKENEDQIRRKSQDKIYYDQLQLVSKDSEKSSDRDREGEYLAQQAQAMQYEKEMFLQQIRSSQQQIFSFTNKIQELMVEKGQLQRENLQLQQLLNGQKVRSDKFDREIMDILNKNQELKLEVLEHKEVTESIKQEMQRCKALLEAEKNINSALLEDKEQFSKQIHQLKQNIVQLKLETSQQRQANSVLQQRQRQYKTKIGQMKKQNEQLRVQLQKIMAKFNEVSQALQKSNNAQALHNKSCLQQQKNKVTKIQQYQREKGHQKMKQISKMHKEITHKLQQKIHLLEKGSKEKKEKNAQLKFQIQRLYESLQIQVQKEGKSTETIKHLKGSLELLEEENKNIKLKLQQITSSKESAEGVLRVNKTLLEKTQEKLKKITLVNSKIISHTLPHLKQQLQSVRLLCKHFSSMIDMQRQQTKYLLLHTKQSLHHFIEQTLLQKIIARQQQNLTHQSELSKWKQNCKLYEQKYSQLNTSFAHLEQKYKKLQLTHTQERLAFTKKMTFLQEQNEKKRVEYHNTQNIIERLRQKCKEVEQYYNLIDALSKENIALKNKLYSASYYSFKSPQKGELEFTSKRRQFTSEQVLQKYNQTTNLARIPTKNEEINLNDLTAKAQYQRMRLQAAKREYRMLNKIQNQ